MKDPSPAPRRFPFLRLLALLALLALAAAAGFKLKTPPPAGSASGAAVSDPFALSLPDADGAVRSLRAWKGKALVVNFWATWCAPCVTELPELDRLHDEFAARDVVVVGIGTEAPERVRLFRDQHHLRLPLLAGGYDSLAIARNWGDTVGVVPYTALFSSDGRLLKSKAGAISPAELRGWIESVATAQAARP
jgi:peroxiredoxin